MTRFFRYGAVAMIAAVVLACAPAPAPTPTPQPAPKPAPAATQAPAPTAAPKPAPTAAPKPAASPAAKPAAREKISFRLAFTPSGLDSSWFLAAEKGFYAEQGLDVELLDGTGSQAAAQQVGNGSVTFGFSDANAVLPGIAQGVPIMSIHATIQKHPNAVIYREDSGIKTPKDLEGRQVGMTAGGGTALLFPGFLKAAKVDASKVSVVNLDARVLMTSLLDNKIPAVATWWVSQGTLAQMSGTNVKWFVFGDYIENAYADVIVANTKTIKEQPDLIRRYLAATNKGIAYGRDRPEEAADATVKHRPALKRDIVLAQWKATLQTFYTDRTRGKVLGWQDEQDWQQTINQLKEIGSLKSDLKPSQVYTNDFMPKS